jgi:hypothetical protein
MTPMGDVTVPHLQRLWSHTCANRPGKQPFDPVEAAGDKIAIYGLGPGLYETLQFLHGKRPDFDAFEDGILARNGGAAGIVEQAPDSVERRPWS